MFNLMEKVTLGQTSSWIREHSEGIYWSSYRPICYSHLSYKVRGGEERDGAAAAESRCSLSAVVLSRCLSLGRANSFHPNLSSKKIKGSRRAEMRRDVTDWQRGISREVGGGEGC